MKLIYLVLTGFLLIATPQLTKAQSSPCGSDTYMAELLKSNPQLLQSLTEYNEGLQKLNYEMPKLGKKGATRTIPVVFHIIHTYGSENITKAQIDDQVRILNLDFQRLNSDTSSTRSAFKGVAADMDLEFKLARIDPSGNCTEGITRTFSYLTDGGDDAVKALVRWDYRKYLNIWVVKNIAMDAGTGGRVLGYAVFPQFTNSTTDGIVILSDYIGSVGTASSNGNKGRVLVHEIGHWLGLYHPFQGSCGGNCLNSGDYICDTPPVSAPSFGCPTTNNTCNNDVPDKLDMIENFMDYANGNCQNLFTVGQKAVVDNVLGNTNYRARNIAPSNHTATGIFTNPSCKAIADFNTSNNIITICQGGTVNFKDYSYNGTITAYAWTFEGGTPSTSSSSAPAIVYSTPGLYKVTLDVTNPQGTGSKTVDKMIRVIPTVSANRSPINEGFESPTILDNDWKVVETGDYGWKRITTTKYEGAAGMVANIEAGTLNNALYNLISAPFDISPLKGRVPKLKFKVAYRPAATGSTEVLTIWVSKDCGQTWSAIKAFSNSIGLGVDKVIEVGWKPTSQADWKELSLDLVNYENTKNLMIKFEARSRSGNSIYLDNINIEAEIVSAIKPIKAQDANISLYPNPSQGSVNIDIVSDGRKLEGVRVINSEGREMDQQPELISKQLNEYKYTINSLSPGVYFAQFILNGQILVKKFVILP